MVNSFIKVPTIVIFLAELEIKLYYEPQIMINMSEHVKKTPYHKVETIALFLYSSMNAKKTYDVALMQTKEMRQRRIARKYSSKELKEHSKSNNNNKIYRG